MDGREGSGAPDEGCGGSGAGVGSAPGEGVVMTMEQIATIRQQVVEHGGISDMNALELCADVLRLRATQAQALQIIARAEAAEAHFREGLADRDAAIAQQGRDLAASQSAARIWQKAFHKSETARDAANARTEAAELLLREALTVDWAAKTATAIRLGEEYRLRAEAAETHLKHLRDLTDECCSGFGDCPVESFHIAFREIDAALTPTPGPQPCDHGWPTRDVDGGQRCHGCGAVLP